MYRLWENKEVWYFLMTAKNLAVGLHCWEHKDYGTLSREVLREDISKSLEYWNSHVSRGGYSPPEITVFFPPWNSSSSDLESVCEEFALCVDTRRGGPVFNFHYWELVDQSRVQNLEKAARP